MSTINPYLKVPISVDGYSFIADSSTLPTISQDLIPFFNHSYLPPPELLIPERLLNIQGELQRADFSHQPLKPEQMGSAYLRAALSIALIAIALLSCSIALFHPFLGIGGSVISLSHYALLSLYNQERAGSESPLSLTTLLNGPYYPFIELEKGNNAKRDGIVHSFNHKFNAAVSFFKVHDPNCLKKFAYTQMKRSMIEVRQATIAYIDQIIGQMRYMPNTSSHPLELPNEIRLGDIQYSNQLSALEALKERFTEELIDLGDPYKNENRNLSIQTLQSRLTHQSLLVSTWKNFIDNVDEMAYFYKEGYKANPY